MSADRSTTRCKVLLVEDTKTLLQMVSMTLEERGYAVLKASNGITALELLGEHTPEVVVLDINLPDIDGFELCKRIKAGPRSRNIPVLMMTDMGKSGFEIMSIEAGADDFIPKPIDPLVLDARIQMVVRRMRRERFANALTGLPANALTEERLGFLITRGKPFAVSFVDIDGFEAFNRRYGHDRGDLVIRHLSGLIGEALSFNGASDPFIGHLGGDDFIFVSDPENSERIAKSIVHGFELSIMDFFDDEDRAHGGFNLKKRNGDVKRYGPPTISIAVVNVTDQMPGSVVSLMDAGAELLRYAKQAGGDTVVVERRSDDKGPAERTTSENE
ncbi:MAG: response regulator [Coriobacteriia bacterium]|nr:response regulator [Coriobacteriia bacterium]MBN2822357.1 response regulator [Coriobacteriia bacterium]